MKKLYTYLCLAITSIVSACHLNAALNIDDILNVTSQHFNIDKTKLVQISPNDDTKALAEKIQIPIEEFTHIYKNKNHIIKIAEFQRDDEELQSLQILKSQMMAKNITPSTDGLTHIFNFDFDGETYKVIAVHPTDMLIVDTSSHNVRKINFSSDDLSQIGKLNPNEKLVQIQPFAQGTQIFGILSHHTRAKQLDEAEKTEEFWGNLLCVLPERGYHQGDMHGKNFFINYSDMTPQNPTIFIIDWSSARLYSETFRYLTTDNLSLNAIKKEKELTNICADVSDILLDTTTNTSEQKCVFLKQYYQLFDNSIALQYALGEYYYGLKIFDEIYGGGNRSWNNRGAQSFKDLATFVDFMDSYIARHIINRKHLPFFHKDIIVQEEEPHRMLLGYFKGFAFNSYWDTTFQLGALFSCNPFCDTANEYNFTNAQGEIKTKFPKAFAETYPNELDYLKSVIKFSDVLFDPHSTLGQLQHNNLSCGFNELALQITAIKYFDFKIKDFENL